MSIVLQERPAPAEVGLVNVNEYIVDVAGKLAHKKHDRDTSPATLTMAEVALYGVPEISARRRICLSHALRFATEEAISGFGIEGNPDVVGECMLVAGEALSGAVELVASSMVGSAVAKRHLGELMVSA